VIITAPLPKLDQSEAPITFIAETLAYIPFPYAIEKGSFIKMLIGI